jgi:hypothetical protein
MLQMIIANHLRDGRVVFLAQDGSWVDSISDGQLILDESESSRLLEVGKRGEQDSLIIDPCLIDVVEQSGIRRPTVFREEIRATGPTVQTNERG